MGLRKYGDELVGGNITISPKPTEVGAERRCTHRFPSVNMAHDPFSNDIGKSRLFGFCKSVLANGLKS